MIIEKNDLNKINAIYDLRLSKKSIDIMSMFCVDACQYLNDDIIHSEWFKKFAVNFFDWEFSRTTSLKLYRALLKVYDILKSKGRDPYV